MMSGAAAAAAEARMPPTPTPTPPPDEDAAASDSDDETDTDMTHACTRIRVPRIMPPPPPERLHFVPGLKTKKRTNDDGSPKPLSEFADAWTVEEALAALRRPGHALAEYLSATREGAHTHTKLYFDTERYTGDVPPTEQQIKEFHNEVECAMHGITMEISNMGGMPYIDFVTASRHGYCAKSKQHKMSFRVFVTGITVPYHTVPDIIRALWPQLAFVPKTATTPESGLWDMLPYKAADQLVCAIGGQKEVGVDPRVLTPLTFNFTSLADLDDATLLSFVVQHYKPDWPVLSVDELLADRVDIARHFAMHQQLAAPLVCDGPLERAAIDALVDCLSVDTSKDREKWLRVGFVLKSIGGNTDLYWDTFLRFSAKSPKRAFVSEAKCRSAWKDLTARTVGTRVTLGTLRMYARKDAPAKYAEWVKQHAKALPKRAVTQVAAAPATARAGGAGGAYGASADETQRKALCDALRARFPDDFGTLKPDTFVIGDREGDEQVVPFSDLTSGLSGTVSAPDFIVYRTFPTQGASEAPPARFLGLLFDDVMVKGPLSNLHKLIPTGADFVLSRSQQDRAELRSVTPNANALVTHYHIGKSHTYIGVEVPGKPPVTLDKKPQIALFSDRVRCAVSEHAAGTPLAWFVNNGIINNGIMVFSGGQRPPLVRADAELAQAWLAFVATSTTDTSSAEDFGVFKMVLDVDEYHFYNRHKGLWKKTKSRDVAANRLLDAMQQFKGGVFFYEHLSAAERRHVSNITDGVNMLRRLLDSPLLDDDNFCSLLDSRYDLLPFNNGVLELSTGVFRPLRWDDYFTRTVGYAFTPRDAVDDADKVFISRFYEQVMPVPEEREMFLRYIAAALGGALTMKAFLVLTDERGGNNGKSRVMNLLKVTFGRLCAPTQSGFLYASTTEAGANSHAANDLSYMGKRLALFDETDATRKLDIGKIKRLSGGAPTMGARNAKADHVTEFRWTAFMVIACNQFQFPQINATDEALMERVMPVPMRAKFSDKAVEAGEPHSYPVVLDMDDKLLKARDAHLHYILDALGRYNASTRAIPLPPGCLRLRAKLLLADPRIDAITEFVEKRVDFDKVNGVIHRTELLKAIDSSLSFKAKMMFHDTKVAQMKKLVDNVMASFSRPFLEDTSVEGVNHKRIYRDCVLLDEDATGTASPMEDLFRAELVRALGYDMPKAHPCWLVYPVTDAPLELDFYDPVRKMAIEYDGKQHYEYPNKFHKTRAEFEQQRQRDAWKDEACIRNKVQLVRVRATSDPAKDVASVLSALGIAR
jgi:hypothetical protein